MTLHQTPILIFQTQLVGPGNPGPRPRTGRGPRHLLAALSHLPHRWPHGASTPAPATHAYRSPCSHHESHILGGAALLSTHCRPRAELRPHCCRGSRPPQKARTPAERVALRAGGPCLSFVTNVASGRRSKQGAPVLACAHMHAHAPDQQRTTIPRW